MCKKTLNENSEHIFVKCKLAEKFFDFIKNPCIKRNRLYKTQKIGQLVKRTLKEALGNWTL